MLLAKLYKCKVSLVIIANKPFPMTVQCCAQTPARHTLQPDMITTEMTELQMVAGKLFKLYMTTNYRASAQISAEHISKNSIVWWQPREPGVSGGLSSISIASSTIRRYKHCDIHYNMLL